MHKVAFMPNSCARTTSPSCLNPAPLITTPPSLGETMGCSGSRCLVERFLSPGTRRVVTSLVKVQNPPQGVPETDPYEIGQLSLPLTSRSRVYAAHFTLCKGWSRLFSMNLWWRFCGVLRSHSPSISALRPHERGQEPVVEMRGVDPPALSVLMRGNQWWRCGESNPGPPACKAGALPTELHPQGLMVGHPGLEPGASVLSGLRSHHLS